MTAFGNIPSPTFSQKAEVKPGDILAAYSPPPINKGVTIKSGQNLVAGAALARETATKKYVAYSPGGAGGVGTVKGFLRQSVDATGGDKQGNIVLGGVLKLSKLTASGAAITTLETPLNARSDADRDYFIF